MANIKSQIKRIRTNEAARLRNKSVKSSLKTAIRSFREAADAGASAEAAALVGEVGDRYVVVRMSDVAPVDSPVYFADGVALAYGMDGADDTPVAEALGAADSVRTFLYTRYELVTVRAE